jgi:hypothetical protein
MRRLMPVLAALTVLAFAVPAAAQTARALGVVRDLNGRPIRGAVVRASNENARPSQVTSTTDDKGRWAMLGLSTGTWQFVVQAEGYVIQTATSPVRIAAPPNLTFTMERDLGPLPGALDRNIAQLVADAHAMRDQGRIDQALTAYQDISRKNPKLTSIGIVLGDTYRLKAAQERDAAARANLLEQALGAYTDVLKTDATNERAKLEIESTRSEITNKTGAGK